MLKNMDKSLRGMSKHPNFALSKRNDGIVLTIQRCK